MSDRPTGRNRIGPAFEAPTRKVVDLRRLQPSIGLAGRVQSPHPARRIVMPLRPGFPV